MISEDEAARLCNIFNKKKTLRRNWDWQWEQLALYIQPGKADFITQRTTGDRERNKFMYDSTAAVANHTLASHMHSAMTNPAQPWAEMQFRDRELRDDDPAQEWIQDCTRRMFDAINDSNFVSVINESYQNLCCFGTACLETTYTNREHEGFKLVFRYVPLHELVFLENVHSRIDTVFREVKYTARQVEQMFPESVPEEIADCLKENTEKEFTLLKCVRPNPDYNPRRDLSEKNRQFVCHWMHKKKPFHEEYYFELPYHIPRWSKMDTEVYGYGPGLMCYPEIRSLNEAKRLELAAWEKAIDSSMFMQVGNAVGDIDRSAGGVTYVRDIRGLMFPGAATDWNATQVKAEELRTSIQQTYLIDQLILPERPNATATEVQIRYTMMQRVLGPTAGRLEAELLNPLVNRIFGIMYRAGQFKPMPEGLEGADYDIKYTGPLARAQSSDEANAIQRVLELATNLLPVYPTALDGIEVDKAIMRLAQQWGAPADVLRSEEEIAAIAQQRAQAQQQQAAMQQAQESANVEQTQAQAANQMAQAEQLQ